MQTAICFVLETAPPGLSMPFEFAVGFHFIKKRQKTIRWSLDIFVKIKRQKDLLAQRTSRVVTSCNMLLKLSPMLPHLLIHCRFRIIEAFFVFVLISLKRWKSKKKSKPIAVAQFSIFLFMNLKFYCLF